MAKDVYVFYIVNWKVTGIAVKMLTTKKFFWQKFKQSKRGSFLQKSPP
jgi:hypothetical protein